MVQITWDAKHFLSFSQPVALKASEALPNYFTSRCVLDYRTFDQKRQVRYWERQFQSEFDQHLPIGKGKVRPTRGRKGPEGE
jgi:hypothetical protein